MSENKPKFYYSYPLINGLTNDVNTYFYNAMSDENLKKKLDKFFEEAKALNERFK